MALTAYLQQTQLLLNDPANQLYTQADLTAWVNEGRSQLAVRSEVLINTVTYSITVGVTSFALSALTPNTGFSKAINVRSMVVPITGTKTLMEGRPWQWLQNYYLTGSNSALTGAPTIWAQQMQGSAGTVYVWKTPDATYALSVEASWTPIPLVDDTTVENIPYPWTDAIPFYAAGRALQQAQRTDDAMKMFQNFDVWVRAARLGVTPETMPNNFPTMKGLPTAIDPNATLHPNAAPSQVTSGSL